MSCVLAIGRNDTLTTAAGAAGRAWPVTVLLGSSDLSLLVLPAISLWAGRLRIGGRRRCTAPVDGVVHDADHFPGRDGEYHDGDARPQQHPGVRDDRYPTGDGGGGDHGHEYPGCGLAMGIAPLGDVPAFQLFPRPVTLPVRDFPGLPLSLASPRRIFERTAGGRPSARKTMPSNTASPRIATTAVSIIPVVVPRSSTCDVLSSGGGYTLLYLLFSSLVLAAWPPAASADPKPPMACRAPRC